MARVPSAAELIEALRRDGESYEALAARLPISLSTVSRWKNESPRDWNNILTMLDLAGWLVVGGSTRADRAGAVTAADLAPALEQIADGLGKLDALVSAQSQRATGRRRRSA